MTRLQQTRTLLFATTLALFADTFLPWQKVAVTVAGLELASATANAWCSAVTEIGAMVD
jgi:hypothetical protein